MSRKSLFVVALVAAFAIPAFFFQKHGFLGKAPAAVAVQTSNCAADTVPVMMKGYVSETKLCLRQTSAILLDSMVKQFEAQGLEVRVNSLSSDGKMCRNSVVQRCDYGKEIPLIEGDKWIQFTVFKEGRMFYNPTNRTERDRDVEASIVGKVVLPYLTPLSSSQDQRIEAGADWHDIGWFYLRTGM